VGRGRKRRWAGEPGLLDPEGVVNPCEISVGPVATELGRKLKNGDLRPCRSCLLNEVADRAGILDVNLLILINEKGAALGSVHDFLDLVLTDIRIKSGLFIQPVRLVYNEGIIITGLAIHKST
jgi:hypothetical protein